MVNPHNKKVLEINIQRILNVCVFTLYDYWPRKPSEPSNSKPADFSTVIFVNLIFLS